MGVRKYSGKRDRKGNGVVHVITGDGDSHLLALRLDLRNHSPSGFDWSYRGSGPAQLALALLVNATNGDTELALRLYQSFKDRVIATLPHERWSMTQLDVLNHLKMLVRSEGGDVETRRGTDKQSN